MKQITYISALLIISFKLFAQSPRFIFHNVGERQGMSANYSYTIFKDSRGTIWIGTAIGLSRFDGSHFYNFRAGNDSNSLINNAIIDLCEDKEGNIWGGTGSGIFCYQPQKNSFKNYIPPTYDFARGVKNIICDRNGNIWASSEWNILRLNKQKNLFEEIGPLTKNYDSLSAYSVRQNGLVEDPNGKGLWFATRSGLHFYNTEQEKFYSHKNSPDDSIFTNHSVAALSLSKSGNFWFFDNVTKEIISFDPETHKILQRINMRASMPNAFATTLFEDSHHMLWFSTWDNRIAVIDYRKNIATPIAYSNNNPLSIAGDLFWDCWEDKNNTIWLATAGGLSKCNYSKNAYSITPILEIVPEFKQSKLGAFTIDLRDNSWWIASEGDINMIHYYPNTGKYIFFDFSKAIKNSKGQLPGPVYTVSFLDGQPYACTHNGVWQLNEKTKNAIPFEKKFEGLPVFHFTTFTVHGNDVWFTTRDGHIKWNKISNRAILVRAAVDSFPDGQRIGYHSLLLNNKGRPWYIPAFGWLALISEKNEVVMKYYVKNKVKELSGYVTSLTEDKKGNLWMASVNVGLYKYDVAKAEMKLYDQPNGIPSNITAVLTDKDDRIWIAAANKISVFNSITQSIRTYNLPLYENTIDYYNIFQADSNGSILVTVNKDIVKFIPERLNQKPVIEAPIISGVKIMGVEKLIYKEKKLNLEPDENSLEFSFGSLMSDDLFPYTLEFKLDGFDKEWTAANPNATAQYNNLLSGNYVFMVRVVAKDRSWKTPEQTIQLVIRTPFYRAFWFWLLIVGLLVSGFVFFYRFKIDKQRQIFTLETKAESLEKEKAMIQYESLKQHLNPHFLFNSLTSLRSLIKTDSKTAAWFLDGLSKVYRYVLKSADQELVLVSDEVIFVTTFAELQKVRFGEGFQVNIHISDAAAQKNIAPVVLQNLIENAIKHNTTSTDSPLVVDIFDKGEYLQVRNNLQRYRVVETSNQQGLNSLRKLYSFYTQKRVLIEEDEQYFAVHIPLL